MGYYDNMITIVVIISYLMRKNLPIPILIFLLILFPTEITTQSRVCPNSYFFDAQHC